jgi:Sec-independent protein translocase protein TatA
MPFLSPAKLLVILVVAVIVLGPDKLPKVAHQVGSLWRDLRRLREKL